MMKDLSSREVVLILSLIMTICVVFYIATLVMMSITNNRVFKIWKSMEDLGKRQNEVEKTVLSSLSEIKVIMEKIANG